MDAKQLPLVDDRISILPDDLLHHVLSFLPTKHAVRTSVLSRRWRRVWVGHPTFSFDDDKRSTAGFAESVDEVLAKSTGMDLLEISVGHPLHTARANDWLRRAAERCHRLIFKDSSDGRAVLDLPCGGRATDLSLHFTGTLRVPPSALHRCSLTALKLKSLQIDGSSFSDYVSSSCPRLKKLHIHAFGDTDCLRLSNDALEDLDLSFTSGGLRRLEVSSRNLRRLRIENVFSHEIGPGEGGGQLATIRAPRLEELSFVASVHPSRVEFADGLDTVRHLSVGLFTHDWVHHPEFHRNELAVWLLQSCTAVRCHRLSIMNSAPDVIGVLDHEALEEYEDLMAILPQLTTVTNLTVTTMLEHHAYGPSIATLLSKCSRIEKLTVLVKYRLNFDQYYTCIAADICWCKCPLDWRDRKLRLDLLREIDFGPGFPRAHWLPDLAMLLRTSRPDVPIKIKYSDGVRFLLYSDLVRWGGRPDRHI